MVGESQQVIIVGGLAAQMKNIILHRRISAVARHQTGVLHNFPALMKLQPDETPSRQKE